MAKFLNNTGLARLVALIKQALGGKADKTELPLVVTFTGDSDNISCDTSIADIYAAYSSGRVVVGRKDEDLGEQWELLGCNTTVAAFSAFIANNQVTVVGTNNGTSDSWSVSYTEYQEALTFDSAPTAGSGNPVTSGGVKTALDEKQATLVSGTNIKSINNASILGSGNIDLKPTDFLITVSGSGSSITADKTYEQITTAFNAGRNLIVKKGDDVFHISHENGREFVFVSEGKMDNQLRYKLTLTSQGEWVYLYESIDATEISVVNDDTHGRWYNGDQVEEALVALSDAIDDLGTPNEIESITTTESQASGGNNTVTIEETNGTSHTFNVKNGKDGADGVSLGEVALVQTTGDSEESVMSQKAVTEYGRKLLDEEATNGIGTMMREILTSLGWEFDKYTQAHGTIASSTNTAVTPYIEIGECGNHVIEAAYFLGADAKKFIVFFNSNKTWTTYSAQYETNRYSCTLGNVSTKYVRYTVHVDRIRDCYIYDHTAKQFLFKGDEYLDNIINNYNVSYGYIGDKDILKYTFIKPTCFLGTLCYYKLSQFPNLDPRTCDGLSVALDGTMSGSSWGNLPFLLIRTGSNNFNTDNYFAIASNWDTIKCGVLTNYYGTVVNGCSLTKNERDKFAHLVITFDFKTGTITYYNNGVLKATNIPETYSESDLRTFLDSCTELYLSWGLKTSCMAVFPYVLTSDDVKSIYGIGASSTKGELIPDVWNANILHPQTYSGQNIGIYLRNTNIVRSNEGNTAVLTSNSTSAQFGFTGINGTINNHIYEWDMEVVSGTWTQYSRGMIYNNNYYKVVNIYDSNGNNVSYDTLNIGNYHVVCKPDNILARYINADQDTLNYIFTTTEGAVMKITNLKVVEKGAALICGVNNFRGNYFEQKNNNKVPITRDLYPYNSTAFTDYYTTYKEDIVEYSSSTPVQFAGQMAVDINNNRVYVGYLTGAGTSIWKQINNS